MWIEMLNYRMTDGEKEITEKKERASTMDGGETHRLLGIFRCLFALFNRIPNIIITSPPAVRISCYGYDSISSELAAGTIDFMQQVSCPHHTDVYGDRCVR